ncbi:unnamed protein product [Arabis nemorensis]|uniref:Uncharacterized protein n=1 Tax=Arabis nemorensis TaxID=586526 RepID=A0A565CTE7_9BRAS|nr:unnamed protein product [Arabis nemorensis]
MVNHIAAATCDTPFNFLKRKEHQKKSRVTRFPQSFVARTWQTQDQSRGETDMAAIAPPLFLNAASSGFSLSATCPPSSFTGILHLSRSFNLNLPGLYVIHPTGNTSQSPTSSAIAACLLRKVRVSTGNTVTINSPVSQHTRKRTQF